MNVNKKAIKVSDKVLGEKMSHVGSTMPRCRLGTDIECLAQSRHWVFWISSWSRQKRYWGHPCKMQTNCQK